MIRVEHKTTRDWGTLSLIHKFDTVTTLTVSNRLGLEGVLTLRSDWSIERSAQRHALEVLSRLMNELAIEVNEEYYRAKENVLLAEINAAKEEISNLNKYIAELEAGQNGSGDNSD